MYKRAAILCCLVLAAPAARAETDDVDDADVAPAPSSSWGRMGDSIDHFHETVSRGIIGTVRHFDQFFGEDLIDTRDDDTLIRLASRVELRESHKISVDNYASFRLALPRLHDKVQLIFDDIVEKNEEKDTVQEIKDSQPLTGVRYIVRDEKLKFNTDVGLRLTKDPDVFVRGRVSRLFPKDPWSLKLSDDVYWFARDGFGDRAEMRISRRLNHKMLARSTSRVTWEEKDRGVTFSQILSLYHQLSPRRALRWSVAAEMPSEPEFAVDTYKVEANWRQLIHGDWLYAELTPGFEFPREREYAFTPYIQFKLEMMLGDAPDLPGPY